MLQSMLVPFLPQSPSPLGIHQLKQLLHHIPSLCTNRVLTNSCLMLSLSISPQMLQ